MSHLVSHGRAIVAACALLFCVTLAGAQSTASYRARVVDRATQLPVAGALVAIEGTSVLGVSDSDGIVRVDAVPDGTQHVTVSADGYTPLRLAAVFSPGVTIDGGTLTLSAQLHYSEVVSVAPTSRNQFDTYQPTTVLAGQDLAAQIDSSLGATLAGQPGIAQRSLGPGPSRPVIRGLDGDRVLILEDGARTGDLSSQSGDHGVAANPAAAGRVEVVRGPATLLHGASAIGGLVNVISDVIPTVPTSTTAGTMQVDASTGGRDGRLSGNVLVGNGRWAVTVGGSGRRAGLVRTPDGAVDNSQSQAMLGSVGLSRTFGTAYLGTSYQYDDSRYGVPVVEEGKVVLTPRRHALTARGQFSPAHGPIASVRAAAGLRRYRHEERVAGVIGTRFRNDSVDVDVLAQHRPVGRLTGTIGAWGMTRTFEAIGAEALSPRVDQRGTAAFVYEEVTWPHVTLQFGGRVEHASFSPRGGLQPRTFTGVSSSLGVLLRPSENTTLAVSLARAVRNPALEELYFYGPHPGNFAFEIGNDRLKAETALGVDASFRWRLPRVTGEVAYFNNTVSDFIFRLPISTDLFHERYERITHGAESADSEGDHHGHGEFPFVVFTGADSRLQGMELHSDVDLGRGLHAETSVDLVRATLIDSGQALPRIPPARATVGLRYQRNALQMGASVTFAGAQRRVYGAETTTDGYALTRAFVSYARMSGPLLHTLTFRLDNATNARYRNHLSLIKDSVTEMGRSAKVIYSVRF